jgi:hypothetical protein
VWTPKRIVILLGGLTLFLSVYVVYAYFLGGIDGLPILSAEFLPGEITEDCRKGDEEGQTERKLKLAFGNECPELSMPIKLNLPSKGLLLAASQFEIIETDGRVKLSPFSAALFPKNSGDTGIPEINTVQCEVAYLTLDRPVTNMVELNNRKIIAVELLGNRGVLIINNRRTAEKNDDVEILISQAPLYFEEHTNRIWTDGFVVLQDWKTQPNPTKITSKGMEIKLADATAPNRPKVAAKAKGKGDSVSGVELLKLKSNVDMHLYVDATSGFLAGPGDPAKAKPAPARGEPEKSHVVIHTAGPFHYDLQQELAWFDSPPPGGANVPGSPEQVHAEREHKVGDGKKYDQLVCDHLELQFRKKTNVDPKAPRDPQNPDKEIETALATTRTKLTLTMDTEELEAYGTELHYRSPSPAGTTGPQTILKGSPMNAVKEGHKIEARELHLIGADKYGNGQQAFAQGPGRIDLFDKSNKHNPYPSHAVWRDSLISVKERDGDKVLDVLTLTGNASFIDDEHKQKLTGQRLQVWLEADAGDAANKRADAANNASKQKPSKIEAFEKVTAHSPEMIVHQAQHLEIRFKNQLGADAQLPAPSLGPLTPSPAPAKEAPGAGGAPTNPQTAPPPAEAEPKGLIATPTKNRKPIELWANDVLAYVTTQGDKKELQELWTRGAVHVHQEGASPQDKGVDITGNELDLEHHPRGDTLRVYGDSQKFAQLQLGELIILGPKVTINQKDNTAEVAGAGALSMPSDTSFNGGKPAKAKTRLNVHWNKDMFFNGKNADFHGGVQAFQDNANLKCQDLYVTLDRVVSFKEGQKENQDAKVEKLLCDLKVWVEDEKKDADGKRVAFDRLVATQLTMDNQEGPIIAVGQGKVEHLAKGSADDTPAAAPRKVGDPKAPEVMKLTRIIFETRMFSNGKDNSRNAKFYDNVEVFHFPTEDADAKMNPDSPPKDGFYMRCNVLNVFTRQVENKSSQMMKAEGNVFFRTDDFFGTASVVKYDESQDQVIFEGAPGNPAALYRKRPGAGSEPQEIKGNKILYNRKTGVFELGGGKVIQGWQRGGRNEDRALRTEQRRTKDFCLLTPDFAVLTPPCRVARGLRE